MQTDMHYYGTYAMAAAAGLNPGAAQTIAGAAEYVDDSDYVEIQLADEVFLDAPPTAHHPVNRQNLNEVDQRRVWVPFHFIPGNDGDTFEERLICRRDSAIAREMLQHHVAIENLGFNLELMGIAAHCYADTFSHYGFAGIASDLNQVDPDSIDLKVKNPTVLNYILNKTKDFNDKYVKGAVANAVRLGHGAASTYPDRPYLAWSFTYEATGESSGLRENQKTFLEACENLHDLFVRFGDKNPHLRIGGTRKNFPDIRGGIAGVLAVEGGMDERIAAWQGLAASGALSPQKAAIPVYDKNFAKDVEIMKEHSRESIAGTNAYAFLAAAKYHRDYMLEELLPAHDLHVIIRS